MKTEISLKITVNTLMKSRTVHFRLFWGEALDCKGINGCCKGINGCWDYIGEGEGGIGYAS